MPKRSLPVFIVLVLLLAACAPLSLQPSMDSPKPTAPMENAPADSVDAPVETSTPTLTPTPLSDELVVLTNEPLNIVLTSVNLQLDENHIRLTEAANQIATLSAKNYVLETQVATAKTQSASSETEDNNSGSSGSTEYNIPANVYTIVTTANKAYIMVVGGYNKNGAPIMDFYEPRVFFPPGTPGWVYKTPVKADGGGLYYEVYDPSGQSVEGKFYYQGRQIQVKLPNGTPNPAKYPDEVGKAKILVKVSVHEIVGYDKQDKPIMDTYKPIISYNPGKELILYPKFVVATGGSYWYPIYDPDGTPSGYLPATKVEFLDKWD